MTTIVVQDDHIIRALSVILDPDCPEDRVDAFEDYYSVDMPEFRKWRDGLQKKYTNVFPATVILTHSQEELDNSLKEADGVVVEDFIFGQKQLDFGPKIKICHNFRTDMRNIDEAACEARGVIVRPFFRRVNVAVGEHAFALMMTLGKKLVETNKLLTIEELQAEGWPARIYNRKHTANSNWARINGIKNMRGSTLGLVGLGSVGREVARWANAFDMKILYTQRNQLSKDLEKKFNASYRPIEGLFQESDFISIHVPLNEGTRGMIGRELLEMTQPNTIIVNIARADIIQREALLESLESGHLGGIGMDVHYQEPGEIDDPFRRYKNAVLSPHIAIGTRVNGAEDMEDIVSNLNDALGS
ncbi:MAG: 2-hydroxyacid dehydrogenase [Alphaproteobacteria bacterium]